MRLAARTERRQSPQFGIQLRSPAHRPRENYRIGVRKVPSKAAVIADGSCLMFICAATEAPTAFCLNDFLLELVQPAIPCGKASFRTVSQIMKCIDGKNLPDTEPKQESMVRTGYLLHLC